VSQEIPSLLEHSVEADVSLAFAWDVPTATAITASWGQGGVVTALWSLFFDLFFIVAYVWFKASNLIFPLRSTREDELTGLDIPEMGAECYPDYHLTDKSSPPVPSEGRVPTTKRKSEVSV
jgi:hypothetical protein